jgi:hypothetical protein
MKLAKPTWFIWLIAALAGGLRMPAFAAETAWEQPAAALAARIADVLGSGQARLTILNRSSIATDQIPAIRKLFAEDLKAHGITLGGAESATTVHVTLSENARERLWVAEIAEGDDAKVEMVELGPAPTDAERPAGTLMLRQQPILTARDPILAVLDMGTELVLLEPEQIVLFTRSTGGWQEQQRVNIETQTSLARDPRGALLAKSAGSFEAWLPKTHCTGTSSPAGPPAVWNIQCQASDDPWTLNDAPPIRAFYNASRNYFTGVLVPDQGAALLPFYSLAVLPRQQGPAELIGGIDGKPRIVENGSLRTMAGTRDWGSDFAALQSGCGAGIQVIVSSSGDATVESLRAYEIFGSDADPVSEALDVPGAVVSMSTAPDGKSVIAVVHSPRNQYEVDRVTAQCN